MKRATILLALVLLFQPIFCQPSTDKTGQKESLFASLDHYEMPYIEIVSDFKQFKKNRLRRNFQEAKFSIKAGKKDKSSTFTHISEIRQRGKFRCRTCDVPPIKIKFSKKDLKNDGLKKANELKVVLNCQLNNPDYQFLVLKEYLAYKLFNLVSDNSFNVQLIQLKLIDSNSKKKYPLQTAFLLEDEEELAKRLDVEILDTIGISKNLYSSLEYTRFQIFQYMIGNTDWVPTTCHNLQLIRTDANEIIPIPFDFDFSGFVSAPYSIPNSWTDIKTVQDRFFLGNDKSTEDLETVFRQFRSKKEEMIQVISEFDKLPNYERKKMIAYLKSFFKIIDEPSKVQPIFINNPSFLPDRY